jgi:hypothetical protein
MNEARLMNPQNSGVCEQLKQSVRRYDSYSHGAFRARLLDEKITLRACLLVGIRSQRFCSGKPNSSICAGLALLLLNYWRVGSMGSDSIFAFIATYAPSNGSS